MLGCLPALSGSFGLAVDCCRRNLVCRNRVIQICCSLVVFSLLSILGFNNIVLAANLLPINQQLFVPNIAPDSHRLSNIQLAVHFRPGGVDQNQIGDTDSYDARLTQLLYSNECPGCDLRGANLQRKVLNGAKLPRADLNGARFDEAELSAADLTGAYLFGANLSQANLRGTQLINADLRKANLSRADLQGAYLLLANLRKADLRGAQLTGAFLNGADLTGARFSRADLTDADLTNAIVNQSDIDNAILCRTRLPWGDISRDCG